MLIAVASPLPRCPVNRCPVHRCPVAPPAVAPSPIALITPFAAPIRPFIVRVLSHTTSAA